MGKRERELVALLSSSTWFLVTVVWLLLAVPWVCLQFVVVVFLDHTYILFVVFSRVVVLHRLTVTTRSVSMWGSDRIIIMCLKLFFV